MRTRTRSSAEYSESRLGEAVVGRPLFSEGFGAALSEKFGPRRGNGTDNRLGIFGCRNTGYEQRGRRRTHPALDGTKNFEIAYAPFPEVSRLLSGRSYRLADSLRRFRYCGSQTSMGPGGEPHIRVGCLCHFAKRGPNGPEGSSPETYPQIHDHRRWSARRSCKSRPHRHSSTTPRCVCNSGLVDG